MNRTMTMMMVLALSATTAVAQTTRSLQFGAGGYTIAGPGTRTVATGDSETVFLQSAETPLDLCATVVNLSKSDTAAVGVAVFDPDLVGNSSTANGGEAVTVCRKDSHFVRVTCTAGPCEVLWRVDQSR